MNVIAECKKIMAGGVMPECQVALEDGRCNGCCVVGGMLLEGEVLSNVPEGVEVVGNKVKNCLGPDGCKFNLADKPLFCTLSPVVYSVVSGLTGKRITVFNVVESDGCGEGGCPIINDISVEFVERVERCVRLLKENDFWQWGRELVLPRATREEISIVNDFHEIDPGVSDKLRVVSDRISDWFNSF